MADTELPLPTDSELAILNALWEGGPATVREVSDRLERARPVAYTTVLKMLQIMHQKGLVRRDETQRNHVYAAVAPRDRTQDRLIDHLSARAFGGSAERLILRALDSTRATAEERESIRSMLAGLADDDAEETA
ncbi:MAG TPA: BlaI/MecI/CopY family transcriptional regulator [Longimicrobiaceae bacterium]|nr:BlaI/MecI/CopY family transcriptional regulator [Longimicrobiaceae bacterium]